MKTSRLPSIEVQAAIAMMVIQLVHKFVREIPGVLNLGGIGTIVVPVFTGLLMIGIVLLFFRIKWGLLLGLLDAAMMIVQPLIVHVIQGYPDQNGIWWYPIFPWTQAVCIIYFCWVARKRFE